MLTFWGFSLYLNEIFVSVHLQFHLLFYRYLIYNYNMIESGTSNLEKITTYLRGY